MNLEVRICCISSPVRAKNNWTRIELAIGSAVVVVALLLVGLILLRSKGAHSLDSQRCPIDGMAAEWRNRPHGANICNYGHFSVVERQAHTWWGAG
jgi:hypothetical protein